MTTNLINLSEQPVALEDVEAITETSRDYVEGWFTADEERMRRCLHPDLVKRTIWHDPQQGTWRLGRALDAQMMAGYTREGGGSDAPEPERTYEIAILDAFRHIATVKVASHPYMDYLHIAKINNRWLIVNVLWEVRQGETGANS